MARKGETGEDWGGGVGRDRDKPVPPPPGVVSRIRDAFWREMDIIPISVPRWSSVARTNANIKWLLTNGYDEAVIKASFRVFRGLVETLPLSQANPCWDAYFRRKVDYLTQAAEARAGSRDDSFVHTAGDISVDNAKRRRRLLRKDD